MGYIDHIDNLQKKLIVVFDNERSVQYSFAEAGCITLAYAITIHKSQGCEFDCVIVPVYFQNPQFLTRNLIYTAVTRAKKRVILIGGQNALRKMIENDKTQRRLCALKERLQDELY